MARKQTSSDAASSKDPAGGEPPARQPYLVLARKYRPDTFEHLIGQEAMVTTLRNAFASDRIAQGYMLTGVRGVGKTTTARIIARALNYAGPDLPDRPTVEMPTLGIHCEEIIQSRHPDVVEIDAASNTGVDNIREIIESARYKPILARYKVFIIDEVHMLSKGAFNALLKTLEEPPEHVKFIFATTEVRKVPVTVLSRCQRFDLRRVDVLTLAAHFRRIVESESASIEDDALTLIARAAEGSVRDGLSILDQAIAMGRSSVTAALVRDMMGLADRSRIFDLIEHVLSGAVAQALSAADGLYRDGADPIELLVDLSECIHSATRLKVAGENAASEALSGEERRRAGALAHKLTIPVLSRVWQMLLKGIDEAGRAPDPRAASDMVLIRIAHAADLPPPEDVIRSLGGESVAQRRRSPAATEGTSGSGPSASAVRSGDSENPAAFLDPSDGVQNDDADEETEEDDIGPSAVARPALVDVRSFAEVVALAGLRRDARLKVHLEEHVSLVKFDAGGTIELFLLSGAPSEIANELREKLMRWTGRRWIVALGRRMGEPPIGEVERQRLAAEIEHLKTHPVVQAVLDQFPEARIVGVKPLGAVEEDDSATG